jgi:hypothetical protein
MDPNFAPLLPGMGYASNSNHPNGIVNGDGRLNDDVSQFLATLPPLVPNQPTADPHDPRSTTPSFPPHPPGSTPTTAERQPITEMPAPTPKREPQVQEKREGDTKMPELDIPNCIVFNNESTQAYHVVPAEALQKLPKPVLQKLLNLRELQGKGQEGHPALFLGPIPNSRFENLVRIEQFARHGDYEPLCVSKSAQPKFQPPRSLAAIEYQDPQTREQKPWQENATYAIFQAPTPTKSLFALEIETYLFALELGYAALQKRSRERIFKCYPKTSAGVFALIERVFPRAAQVNDTEMMDHVREYVNSNGKSLTNTKGYVSVMRGHMKDNSPLGQVLWETYISSSEALRRDVEKNPPEKDKKAAPPTEQSSPTPSKLTDSLESSIIASKLRWVIQSIDDGTLVKAAQDGYGTLRREDGSEKRWARNQDFKFLKDELFCIDRSKHSSVSTSHNNVVVVNARGDIGDIFRSLTRPVSFADLGTSADANGLGRLGGFNEGTPPPPPPPSFGKKRKYSYDAPGADYIAHRSW